MCTIGGLGRHIGRQSTDVSADSRPIYRPTDGRYIGRYVAINCQWIIGQVSVKHRSSIGQISVDCRPIVGRQVPWQSTDISIDVSADMSTEATYSTHDPTPLPFDNSTI